MPYETSERPAMTVIGRAIRASNKRGDLLGAHWQQFLADDVPGSIEGRTDGTIVAIYCEYEGDHTQPYTFMLGCAVAEDAPVPEGLGRRTVPAGAYARIEAVGEQPNTLIEAWMGVWASGLERGFQTDYEVHDGADPTRVTIYVG